MSKQLPQSVGTFYLAIFDGHDQPIIDAKSLKPVGMLVNNFNYTTDEEDADKGSLVISCNNPDIGDNPSLKYMMPLHLQWGWLLPNGERKIGPLKKVIIQKRKISFNASQVEVNITFACASSLAKSEAPNYKNINSDFESWVKDLLQGNISCEIIDYETTTETQQVIYEKVD